MPGTTKSDAKTNEPNGLVTGSTFHWTFADGTEVTLPLKMKTRTLRRANDLAESDFMFVVLDDIADADAVAAIDEADIMETTEMFKAWSDAWKARVGASLGESSGSSN